MSIQFDDNDFVTIPPIKKSLDSKEVKAHRLKMEAEQKPKDQDVNELVNMIMRKVVLRISILLIVFSLGFATSAILGINIQGLSSNTPSNTNLQSYEYRTEQKTLANCKAGLNMDGSKIELDSLSAQVCESIIDLYIDGPTKYKEPQTETEDNLPSLP